MSEFCITGSVRKLQGVLSSSGLVEYALPLLENPAVPLNPCLGSVISITFAGEIQCIYCARVIKKTYNQGYCFPCAQKLARCDFCIVKPERCHYHLGTCREPAWGEQHCFISHIVYIANTSGLKVGITRETQIPTRWIDQGAIQALPMLKTQNRYHAGLIEVALKPWITDKTDWRKMLSDVGDDLDLQAKKSELWDRLPPMPFTTESIAQSLPIVIQYPVLQYPQKIQTLTLEKTPNIRGTLLGIKGQYLILDVGVLNIRNIAGYKISWERL